MSTLDALLLPTTKTSVKNENRDEFIKALMSSLVLTTKSSNNLPNDHKDNNSFQYFRMFQEFAEATDGCSKTTLALIKSISSYVQKDEKRRIDLPDDIENPLFYESIVDILDVLLDSADSHIKSARTGVQTPRTDGQTLDGASITVDQKRITQSSHLECPKPQKDFLDDIDNTRERPFRPRLKVKYHHCQPLNLTERSSLTPDGEDIDVDENRYMGEPLTASTYFAHPYEAELGTLSYMEWQMVDASQICPDKPVDPSLEAFAFVDTEPALDEMLSEFMKDNVHEIAVDLEHHSMRSFQGLTCLMQISTRYKDYVIDTLLLRRSIHRLGPVFDNPAVVKVFHGCERDILWLQRDFGLYVVNCFDTFYAAKALRYPALSLAHLVRMHCNVVLNKKHQLSDWRQRELPKEMINYARSDTHYLLYTYDCIRRDLWKSLGKEGLENVLDASRKVCLSRYEKPAFYPRGYQRQVKEFFIASKGVVKSQDGTIKIEEISTMQDCVLSRLWNWRDLTARNEDESPEYILSNSELVRIGLAMPTSAAQLERVNSSKGTERAEAILRVINDAISIGPVAVSSSPRSAMSAPIGKNTGVNSKAQLKASKSNAKSAEASTVYTFTPAVLPKPLKGQGSSDFSVSSPVGQILGQRGSMAAMSSPVMAADEIFRLAGWSTPSFFSQQHPANTNASSFNIQHRLSVSPHPNHLGSSDGPFSFASTDALRHVELSDENKQKLERSKEEQKSEFDRKLMKLTASKPDSGAGSNTTAAPGTAASATVGGRVGGKSNSSAGDLRASMESEHSAISGANHSSHSLEAEEEELEFSENQSPTTIPQSYEEIYKISLRNRQRNKDKKRNREGQDQIDPANAESDSNFPIASFTGIPSSDSGTLSDGGGGSMRGKFFDYTTYFSQSGDGSIGKTATLNSVESTLDLASEIGWVKDKTQYEAVKEAYLLEVSNQQQQSSLEGDEQHAPAAGGGGASGNQLRRSHDKQQKSSASGPANGGGVAAGGNNSRYPANAKKSSSGDGSHHHHHHPAGGGGGGQDSSQQLPPPPSSNNSNSNSLAAPQKFDYSKLHSQQAMSMNALPGRDRESRPKGHHGGKPKQDSGSSNPFLYKSK